VDKEPHENIYWLCAKKYVTVEKITVSDYFRGEFIEFPQYKADIIRLEKLIERGGIYLDIDNLSLNSFHNLLIHDLVIGGSSGNLDDNRDQFSKDNIENLESVSNSIILATPDHPFLKKWYSIIHLYMGENYVWAYHAVALPTEILKRNKKYLEVVTILNWNKYFCPRGMWKDKPYIFDEKYVDKKSELDGYYTLVFYQTLFAEAYLKSLTFESITRSNSIFSILFSKYLFMMGDFKEEILELLLKMFNGKEWGSLKFNTLVFKNLLSDSDVETGNIVEHFLNHVDLM